MRTLAPANPARITSSLTGQIVYPASEQLLMVFVSPVLSTNMITILGPDADMTSGRLVLSLFSFNRETTGHYDIPGRMSYYAVDSLYTNHLL